MIELWDFSGGGLDSEMFCMYRLYYRNFLFLATAILLASFSGCTEGSQQEQQAPPLQSNGFPLKIGSPLENGFDGIKLNQAVTQAKALGFVRSVLILRNGELVHETYISPSHVRRAQNIQSISKSILSSLVGIAIEEHYFNLDSKISDFFADELNRASDPRVANITVHQLLSMRSGFPRDEGSYAAIFQSGDWVNRTLSQTLVAEPGQEFTYSTFGSHLLSVIIEKTTGQSTRAFAQVKLFQRLGVSIDHWARDPQGHYFGGNDMFLSSRELALFGQLYLQRGKWESEPILPESWIDRTLEVSSGGDWEYLDFKDWGYAYFWWLGTLNGYPFYTAIGQGGQYLFIVPSQKLVIIVTCTSDLGTEEAHRQEREAATLISRHIIPSITEWYPR